MIQFQTLFDDGDQQVRGDRSPYLRLDRIFCCPKDRLDTQILFDPFKVQLDLPALFVKCEIVNAESVMLFVRNSSVLPVSGLGVGHLSDQLLIPFVRCVPRQLNVLIDYQARVDWERKLLNHIELHIAFGASRKEDSGGMKLV